MRHWLVRNRVSLFSTAIVLAYIAFIQWLLGWATILAQWRVVGLWAILAAVGLMTGSYLLRAWRIRDYFPNETAGRFARLFRLTQIHNLLNVMLPFRSGELSFPMLMHAEFGVSLARSVSALMVMRLLDLHALLAAGAVGLVVTSGRPWLGWLVWCAFLALPAAGYAFKDRVVRLVAAWAPRRAQAMVAEMEAGLPADARLFARAWGMTLLNWFAKVAILAAVLGLMGVEPFSAALGGALGGELSAVLPFHAPAGVGTYPAAITIGALAFGAPAGPEPLEVLGRAGVNVHLMVIVSSLVGTAFSLAAARRG